MSDGMLARALKFLGSLPQAILTLLLVGLSLLVGSIDYATGANATFSSLYLVPIGLAAWFLGQPLAYFLASLSSAMWVAGDFAAGAYYSEVSALAWNVISRFAVFIAASHLIGALRKLHDDKEALAHQRAVQLTAQVETRERLERELLHISEREQRRVGRDIHDSVCQHLTDTALAGQVLAEKLKTLNSPSAESAAKVVELIEDGITLSRNLARGLNAVATSNDGLMVALDDFAATTSELFKIPCRFECPLPVPINNVEMAEHIYRIAQEAVGNAIKHGHAKNIQIRLDVSPAGKRLRIIDDGQGRPPFSLNGSGMGLRIMSYRAECIGAVFSVRRNEPAGTVVTCLLPLDPEMSP